MLKTENRSHTYYINRLKLRHEHKYTKYKTTSYIYQTSPEVTFEAQFMKKLNNAETVLKNNVACKKKRVIEACN